MSKKSIITLITLAAVIIAGICVAISMLYKENPKVDVEDVREFEEAHPMIASVPSDAAIVFCIRDFGELQDLVRDSSAAFGELFSGRLDRLMSEDYESMRKLPAIVSIHYSKDMPSLLVVDAGTFAADSTNKDIHRFLSNADSSGLKHILSDGLMLISSSETIINSSVRHRASGHSIMDADGFSDIASKVSGDDIIFLSHAYSDKILEAYFAKKHVRKASFIKELGKWSAFTIDKFSEKGLEAKGALLYDSDPSYYTNVLQHVGTEGISVTKVLPSMTDYVFSYPIGSMASYVKSYRSYLDSQVRLDDYEDELKEEKKDVGTNAEDWTKGLDIKEIAVAGMHVGDKISKLLFIKAGNAPKDTKEVHEYLYPGFASTMFGELFKADEENACFVRDGWMVIGDSTALFEYIKPSFSDQSLQDYLKDSELESRVPEKDCGFFIYYSMGEDPTIMDATFSKNLALKMRNILKGVTFAPVFISAMIEEGTVNLSVNLDRVIVTKSKAPSVDRDTTVVVPKGPYKVRNSATGKTNTLYQNSYKSICLQDENGKDQWGIPFKEDICGMVESIDYYNNGKIQFLFCAGSKLYLLDRLGRFVGGFPVDLGKEIVLGPKVYDFTGAKAYRAMVLHKDNTIGFYNLHGSIVEGWKGISPGETIKSLPELVKSGNTNYWIVRTSRQAMIYPFMGGECLAKGDGEKMIRPDSKITFDGKGSFTATCYDGKERTIKLKK